MHPPTKTPTSLQPALTPLRSPFRIQPSSTNFGPPEQSFNLATKNELLACSEHGPPVGQPCSRFINHAYPAQFFETRNGGGQPPAAAHLNSASFFLLLTSVDCDSLPTCLLKLRLLLFQWNRDIGLKRLFFTSLARRTPDIH